MSERCVVCETGEAKPIRRDRIVTVGRREYTIENEEAMECGACGEVYLTDEQARASDQKLSDIRRKAEGLLSPLEVKKIRQSLMLSQAQLESALGVSTKTVVRWENGTSVQSKALDDVLRLISLDPDNLRLLVRIRNAALAEYIERQISAEDAKKLGELKEAIYAGIEAAGIVPEGAADRVMRAILGAIKQHRRQKIEQMASQMRDQVAV